MKDAGIEYLRFSNRRMRQLYESLGVREDVFHFDIPFPTGGDRV